MRYRCACVCVTGSPPHTCLSSVCVCVSLYPNPFSRCILRTNPSTNPKQPTSKERKKERKNKQTNKQTKQTKPKTRHSRSSIRRKGGGANRTSTLSFYYKCVMQETNRVRNAGEAGDEQFFKRRCCCCCVLLLSANVVVLHCCYR